MSLGDETTERLRQARAAVVTAARRAGRLLATPVGAIVVVSLLVAYGVAQGKEWGPLNWALGRKHGPKPMLPALFMAATFVALPFAYRYVRGAAPLARRLGLLVLVGFSLYWSLSIAEGGGTRSLSHALFGAMHKELIAIGRDQNLDGLVANYEQMAQERRWRFPRSKPPGCLMVYQGIVKLADSRVGRTLAPIYRDRPEVREERRNWRIEGVAFTLFPLFGFLTVIPLFWLARELAGTKAAELAALFYVTIPTASLAVMVLDSSLYPLLGATAAALTLCGTRRRARWAPLLGGVVLSAGVFVSFSLLALVPFVAALPFVALLRTDGHAGPDGHDGPAQPLRARLVASAAGVGLFVVGFALVHGVALAAGYDPVARYHDAMEFHEKWWSGGGKNWLYGSPLQFFVWLGVPLSAAIFVQSANALLPRRLGDRVGIFLLWALVLVAVTNYYGHTRAEAQRLWFFWAPILLAPAALRLERWERDGGRWVVPILLALQIGMAFVIRRHFTI